MWLREAYLLRTEMKLALTTSSQFFWHVLRLPIRFFSQRSSGDISSRVGLNDKVARLLSGDLASTALNILVILFYAGLMIQYDVVLTLVVVSVAMTNLAALKYVSRKRRDLNQRMLQEQGKMTGAAMGGLQTIQTLKATGSESDFFVRWAGHHAKVVNARQQLNRYTQYLTVVPPFLMALSTALILGIGGLRIIEGALSIGMLIAFQTLMQNFISPVNEMVGLGSKLQEAEGDMRRLDDVENHETDGTLLDAVVSNDSSPAGDLFPSTPKSAEGAINGSAANGAPGARQNASAALPTPSVPSNGAEGTAPEKADGAHQEADTASPRKATPTKLSGYLTLSDITFGYNPLEDPLISELDLHVTPGSRVALVGGSGSGKSTVAKLVCGLHEPWGGEILFDGDPRPDIPQSVMTNSFTFVDQQITLFEYSIRENLTMWDPTVPEEDVMQAAKDACIHEEITTRSEGYDAQIEEGGRNFSGGQRQRLEIARALVCNPTVMVLDEATSALDPTTEKKIDDNIRRRGCTCLIIAHRLSTIRDCDEIVVLDNGAVAQRGTHEEMKEEAGPYAALLDTM
jgi:ATP-binding cassette subfamily C protein